MKHPEFFVIWARVVMATLIPWGVGGCRKDEDSSMSQPDTAAVWKHDRAPMVPERAFERSHLADLPGAIYRNQSDSPIRWQPWSKDAMSRAKAEHRLVFAVIALPQHPGFQEVLADLASVPEVVSAIQESYTPVLIDGDASREIGLLTADLCSESGQGLELPLFLWMTPDGKPLAWFPVSGGGASSVKDLFKQAHIVVSRTWMDYTGGKRRLVPNAGAEQYAERRERMLQRVRSQTTSAQPAEDTLRGLRQLASFYDPGSRTFDEAGRLFPSGSLDLFSTAALHPGIPEEVRARCAATARNLLEDLLPSAMFDPLDGGLFSSRMDRTWSFPYFVRDSVTQTRAAVSLLHAYRATGHPLALERALAVIGFTERHYMTGEGLVSVGMEKLSEPSAWLWTVEEIEKALPQEDADWMIQASGVKRMGNLPPESDPLRQFFRRNSLSLGKTMSELAADQGQAPEAFGQRWDTIREKLVQVRNSRLGHSVRDDTSHAGATFRLVSAYAAAFGATGDTTYRDKAVSLLEKAKAAFYEPPRLSLFSKPSPLPVGAGRAFLHGLALQSVLDVSDITTDEKWLLWAEDLATITAEQFLVDGTIRECPQDANLMNLPVTDRHMLFDDSTAGVVSFAACRLAARERPLPPGLHAAATGMPVGVVDRPTIHTDLLQATLAREFPVIVIVGNGPSPAMKLAVERLPLRMVQRRLARSADGVPEGSVKIVFAKDRSLEVSTPEALRAAVGPSPAP